MCIIILNAYVIMKISWILMNIINFVKKKSKMAEIQLFDQESQDFLKFWFFVTICHLWGH